jgi:hypothetical protein
VEKQKIRIAGFGDLDRPVQRTIRGFAQTCRTRDSPEWRCGRRIRYQKSCIMVKRQPRHMSSMYPEGEMPPNKIRGSAR